MRLRRSTPPRTPRADRLIPQPPRCYSQTELRDRRRAGLLHTYDGRWSLTVEVAAICDPLTQRIAAAPRPIGYWHPVDDLTLVIHSLVHTAVGLLAERDAQRKTAHLDVDVRGRSIRALVDLAERPALPEIGDDALASGTWPATLMLLAQPYSADLADLLDHAMPPGTRRGLLSASERLHAALTDVDRAALTLARKLDRDERARATKTTKTAPTPTDPARAELAALGVSP